MRGVSQGAAQDNLSVEKLLTFDFRVPSLPVQRRIGDILSAYDKLMENSQRRIRLVESMARALYNEWFDEFRFPGSNNEKLIELETGPAPARWRSGRLDAFLDVLETGNRPKGGVGEIKEGVPSIGAESIAGVGQFDFSKTKYIPPEYFVSMKSGIVEDRDVLVYKDGGQPGNFTPHISLFGSGFPFKEMAINSHVYRLRAKRGISQDYLYFYLSSDAVLGWMRMHGRGAAIPSLARDDLRRLPFVVPDADILQSFDAFVKPLVSQILALARQIQNLRQTRDLLLPRLLSGQVRLAEN
jgi:type I restriction enzyme S subunit